MISSIISQFLIRWYLANLLVTEKALSISQTKNFGKKWKLYPILFCITDLLHHYKRLTGSILVLKSPTLFKITSDTNFIH